MGRDLGILPVIDVRNISAGYSGKAVLCEVSLAVAQGEFVTIAGRTGCGKSTLLRLILGSESPASGSIVVHGKAVCRPDRDRGYVPQKYSLFPDKTVLDNITFGPEMSEFGLLGRLTPRFLQRRKELRTQAYRLLQHVSLQECDAKRYPDELSGGMQQRVAVAQALMMKPKVLLMDEAFSALDAGTRTSMQRLIREVWEETGTTILFVTHNLAEAVYLGSRTIVLANKDGEAGSRVVLDLEIPPKSRLPNGYPRKDDLNRFVSLIEAAALGSERELEMAEFGG